MKEYPEYVFMSSQPQLYKYVKKNARMCTNRSKKESKKGRWEPDGGMFVEADCNIASGEALVRQFVHGQRFFKEEFGGAMRSCGFLTYSVILQHFRRFSRNVEFRIS